MLFGAPAGLSVAWTDTILLKIHLRFDVGTASPSTNLKPLLSRNSVKHRHIHTTPFPSSDMHYAHHRYSFGNPTIRQTSGSRQQSWIESKHTPPLVACEILAHKLISTITKNTLGASHSLLSTTIDCYVNAFIHEFHRHTNLLTHYSPARASGGEWKRHALYWELSSVCAKRAQFACVWVHEQSLGLFGHRTCTRIHTSWYRTYYWNKGTLNHDWSRGFRGANQNTERIHDSQ